MKEEFTVYSLVSGERTGNRFSDVLWCENNVVALKNDPPVCINVFQLPVHPFITNLF